MDKGAKRQEEGGAREQVTVSLPAEVAERLRGFCREMRISPDVVVERALIEYFHEGDVSH